jgi:hypothetical protein
MRTILVALLLTGCGPQIDPSPGLYPPYVEAGHRHDAAREAETSTVAACIVPYGDADSVAFEQDCDADAACVVNEDAGLVGYCGQAPL